MKKLLRSALLAVVTALIAPSAEAAPVELTASTDGTGSFSLAGATDTVSKANLVLKRDGRFSLGLVGRLDNRIVGNWRPTADDRIALRIDEVADKDARGAGEIELRSVRGSYEVAALTLNAQTSKGQGVFAKFREDKPAFDWGWRPVPPAAPQVYLDASRAGSGRLRIDAREAARISRIDVTLFRNGTAQVTLTGSTRLSYNGVWSQSGIEAATLDVRGGLSGERMQGTVRHRTGRIGRLELGGTRNGRYHSIYFEPAQ